MAPSCGRLFRFFSALFVPLAAIAAFSCLLTFLLILYQPTPGPGVLQRLGWQSWDAVTPVGYFDGDPVSPDQPSTDTAWWNVTAPAEDASSYPTDAWMPLWPHDTGRAFRPTHPVPSAHPDLASIRDSDHRVYDATRVRRPHV